MMQLRVNAIKWETPDTATYFLTDVSGKKINYQAGQFITLVIDHHGQELRRSYSISSAPDEGLLAITIKRIPNGELSRFLLIHTKVGDVWQAVGPAGRFIVNQDGGKAGDLFFFAAGSGITPILSQLKYLLSKPGKSRAILIYSNPNANSILFKTQLDNLQQTNSARLTVIYLLSDARRLNNIMAEQLVRQYAQHNLQQALFYLCGPFGYMRMVRLTLIYMGIHQDHIRRENFVLDTVAVSGVKTDFAPHKVRIIFGGETHDIVAGENQSILQAALQNNIPLPYSCRAGICSACAAKCVAGKVMITENDVLTDADLADGWILTCTGYAMGDDVVVRLPSTQLSR